jgi:hypothetical protein
MRTGQDDFAGINPTPATGSTPAIAQS